jgi:hypothetical protein
VVAATPLTRIAATPSSSLAVPRTRIVSRSVMLLGGGNSTVTAGAGLRFASVPGAASVPGPVGMASGAAASGAAASGAAASGGSPGSSGSEQPLASSQPRTRTRIELA